MPEGHQVKALPRGEAVLSPTRAEMVFEPSPAPSEQGFVIRKAKVVADRRTIEQPKEKLRLVLPVPSIPGPKHAATGDQAAEYVKEWLEDSGKPAPKHLRPGELLQKYSYHRAKPCRQGIEHEQPEPVAGNSPVRTQEESCKFPMFGLPKIPSHACCRERNIEHCKNEPELVVTQEASESKSRRR